MTGGRHTDDRSGLRRRLSRLNQIVLLIGVRRLALAYGMYLAGTDRFLFAGDGAVVTVAFYAAIVQLESYNIYAGRAVDAVAVKAPIRPLAGVARRTYWVEAALTVLATVAIALPILVSVPEQAVANAVAMGGYAIAYRDRSRSSPSPVLKTASATLAAGFTVGGLILGLGAEPTAAAGIVAVVLVWRAGLELADDAVDLEGDRRSGARTLPIVHGVAAVLTPIAYAGAAAAALYTAGVLHAAMGLTALEASFCVVGGVVVTGALALSARSIAIDDGPASWYAVRQAFYLLVIVGTGQMLAVRRGVLVASAFCIPVVTREAIGFVRRRRAILAGGNAW